MNMSFASTLLLVLLVPTTTNSGDSKAATNDKSKVAESIEIKQPLLRHPDRVDLSFAVAGRLQSVSFEEGQVVQGGAVLATLENDREKAEYTFRKAKAEAVETLETAKARVASSTTARARATEANSLVQNAIPSQELRRLDLDLELAKAELKEKKLERDLASLEAEIAKATYEATILSSPFTGTITRKLLSKGASIDGLKPIGQIVDTKRLRVEGYVSLDEARNLRVGDTILVRQQSGNEIAFELGFIDIGAQQVQKLIRVWGQSTEGHALTEGEAISASVAKAK